MSDGTLLIIKEVEIIDSVKLEIECPGKVLFIEKGSPIVVVAKVFLNLQALLKSNDQIETDFLPLTQLRTRSTETIHFVDAHFSYCASYCL